MTNNDLYQFWFAEARGPRDVWFKKNPEFDREVAERFTARLDSSVGIEPADTRERLGLILLFDQVPRNAFRENPRSFAYDPRALALTRAGLAAGDLEKLNPLETLFFLLPLEHAEDLEHQRECVAHLKALDARAPGELQAFTREILDYARRHEAIIARFGRFPHRNAILGRESSKEELDFLQQPGSRF